MLGETNSRPFNCYAVCTPSTKPWGLYSSTERIGKLRGEALAEGCRDAADANDAATPMGLEMGTTSTNRVGS